MPKGPLIIDIKGNALDDGPGIRSVVFFKGCPLDCVWCQNPESKRATAELSWDREECVECGTCITFCPEEAISREHPFFVDRERCSLCFVCVEECPSGALSRIGSDVTVDEVVRKIVRYKPFFDTSGGGATLSGGEPTLYMQFASTLLKKLKAEGIHTLVETCGLFDLEKFESLILPFVDAIYMDVKVIDPIEHRRLCGASNERILHNLIRLHEASLSGQFTLLPRVPLIPGLTDGEAQIRALAAFFRDNRIPSVALLPNNPVWLEKPAKLGQETPFGDSHAIREFYSEPAKSRVMEQFSQHGVSAAFG
jgi:pyruvate formate lyase activating enzyme